MTVLVCFTYTPYSDIHFFARYFKESLYKRNFLDGVKVRGYLKYTTKVRTFLSATLTEYNKFRIKFNLIITLCVFATLSHPSYQN